MVCVLVIVCLLSILPDGCAHSQCDYYAVCVTDGRGNGECQCPKVENCPKLSKPVCGTDGNTYDTICHMKSAACHQQSFVVSASDGACGMYAAMINESFIFIQIHVLTFDVHGDSDVKTDAVCVRRCVHIRTATIRCAVATAKCIVRNAL